MGNRVFIAFALLATGLLLGGCATSSMDAMPRIAEDGETGSRVSIEAANPQEERLNFWPILYRRGDVASVLWPLVSVTPAGHALLPFYDWDGENGALRILTIHYKAPSAAYFDKDRWHVVNVIRHRTEGWFFVFPLYYADDEGVWSPLITWRDDLQGAAGPIINHYDDGQFESWSPLWPFISSYEGDAKGFHAFPLFMHRNGDGEGYTNIGLLLFHRDFDGRDHETHVLWPLARETREGDERSHYAFPLWSYVSSGDDTWFWSLPFSRVRDDGWHLTNVLLPLYFSAGEEESEYTTALFPLWHQYESEEKKAQSLFPLFLSFQPKDEEEEWEFYSLPLTFSSGGSKLGILGPLYWRLRGEEKDVDSVLFPLSVFWSGKESWGSWIAPLYYYTDKGEDGTLLATPLGGYAKDDDSLHTDVLGPLFYRAYDRKDGESYTSVLFPFWHSHRSSGRKTDWLVPLFFLDRHPGGNDWSWYSFPLSFGFAGDSRDDGTFFNLGTLVAHYWGRSKTDWSLYLLLPFIGIERDQDSWESYAFPLFWRESTPSHFDFDLGLGLLWRQRDQARNQTEHEVAGSIRRKLERLAESDEVTTAPLNAAQPGFKRPAASREDKNRKSFFGWFTHQERLGGRLKSDPQARTLDEISPADVDFWKEELSWLFPFYYFKKTEEEKAFNLLLSLYQGDWETRERDGARLERQRVLGYLYRRLKTPEGLEVDAFPFLSHSRSEDYIRTSFAGGLLEYRKKDSEERIKLLYIPIGL